ARPSFPSRADVTLERIDVAGDPPVRGVLHPAAGPAGLVLAHGRGGTMDAPLLVAVAEAFVARGVVVLRCNLPYRQSRPSGPPSASGAPRDRQGLRAALGLLRSRARGRLFLGGLPYGGPTASMLLAGDPALASGSLLQSYALHPPGHRRDVRSAHPPAIPDP